MYACIAHGVLSGPACARLKKDKSLKRLCVLDTIGTVEGCRERCGEDRCRISCADISHGHRRNRKQDEFEFGGGHESGGEWSDSRRSFGSHSRRSCGAGSHGKAVREGREGETVVLCARIRFQFSLHE